ncbi:hypothetical protein [Puerhibacterium puerhi]|nr:hypothetical protein [Puerhibacterium puerhi]
MSETDDRSPGGDEPDEQDDASGLSDEGVGATMSDEPNTMEPEEGLPPEE